MKSWTPRNLGSLIESVSETFKFTDQSVVFLNTSDILAGKFLHAEQSDPKTLPGQAKKRIKKGDLLFSEIRPANKRYASVDFDADNYVVSTKLMVLRSKGEIDIDYLKLYLTSDEILDYLQMIAEDRSGTFPQITFDILDRMEILLPPFPEQKAIVAVLSSLDDKIDLLQRQNKTLEAMAASLFRQWFVEEAQADWEEKSLLGLVELVGGGTPKTSMPEYWVGDIPWLSGGDIATNHKGFVSVSEKTISKAGLENSSAKLLPKFATVISARGTVGKYCLLANEMTFSQSNYGILPRIKGCYFFTYLLVDHVVEELQSAAYGSVFDTITTSTFREAKFSAPPVAKVLEFEGFIANYFDKKLVNQTQIRTLEKLRDTLLPKLMSGEVRVVA